MMIINNLTSAHPLNNKVNTQIHGCEALFKLYLVVNCAKASYSDLFLDFI